MIALAMGIAALALASRALQGAWSPHTHLYTQNINSSGATLTPASLDARLSLPRSRWSSTPQTLCPWGMEETWAVGLSLSRAT